MKLALYRGPATGILNTLGHWLICAGTLSPYSHCAAGMLPAWDASGITPKDLAGYFADH